MTPYILFEIDNGLDLNTRSRFLRHLDTLRAMGKLKHPDLLAELTMCDAFGHLGPAYKISAADYVEHVMKPGWTNGQDRVYSVDPFGKTYSETPDLKASLSVPVAWTGVPLHVPHCEPSEVWFYDPVELTRFFISR